MGLVLQPDQNLVRSLGFLRRDPAGFNLHHLFSPRDAGLRTGPGFAPELHVSLRVSVPQRPKPGLDGSIRCGQTKVRPVVGKQEVRGWSLLLLLLGAVRQTVAELLIVLLDSRESPVFAAQHS